MWRKISSCRSYPTKPLFSSPSTPTGLTASTFTSTGSPLSLAVCTFGPTAFSMNASTQPKLAISLLPMSPPRLPQSLSTTSPMSTLASSNACRGLTGTQSNSSPIKTLKAIKFSIFAGCSPKATSKPLRKIENSNILSAPMSNRMNCLISFLGLLENALS